MCCAAKMPFQNCVVLDKITRGFQVELEYINLIFDQILQSGPITQV